MYSTTKCLVVFLEFVCLSAQEVLEFKVGMPEFICDKTGGVKDITSDMTTIRFLGKDAGVMDYKFDVNFKRVGKKCENNQRCTLIAWRRVRELDNYLKQYPAEQIQNGMIQINNTMLDPGIRYILSISVMNEGEKVDEKQLSLDYVDESMKKTVEKPMASVDLLGPSSAYAFAPITINAEISICSNVSSFNYKWELYDSNQNLLKVFYEKGAELVIPADTFQALNTYTIKCSLINLDEAKSIANNQDKIRILSKGLLLDLPVKSLTTSTGQPVRIRAFIRDLDNLDGDIEIKWKCEDLVSNEDCVYQSDTSELEMDSGFDKPGQYKISLDIAKGDFSESAFCTVDVIDNVPVMELEETEYPVSPSSGVVIRATIYQLRTHCTLQWTAPDEEGYEIIDLNTIPGNMGRVINITTKEDIFLQEIEEFSNDTVDRSHDLIIPEAQGNWEGLKGDAKYLFRLVVQCPSAESEDYEETGNDTEVVLKQVIVTNDVVISTNSAPKIKNLEVKPLEGVAYLTKFTFTTTKAEDKTGDEPFLYKYGYIHDGKDVVLFSLAEITNCETTLPFSKNPLETYLEVCDSFGSCGRHPGPDVQTTLPEILDDTYKKEIMQEFQNRMKSEQYYKAFSIAATLPRLEEFPEAHDLISGEINVEIDKFLSMDDDENSAEWKPSANNLIKNINLFNSDLQLPDGALNKLIELRNKVSDVAEKYSQRKLLSFERFKRADLLTVDDVKGFIELSELIITSSADLQRIKIEKENLRKKLPNYLQKLCSSLYHKPQIIQLEFKTMILSVEKLTKHTFNSFQSIPFENNNWKTSAKIKLGQFFKNTPIKMCLGKVILKDYLDKEGFLFLAEILNSSDENNNEISQSNEILTSLPIDKARQRTPKCIVFDNEWHHDCKTLQITKFIRCSCKRLGFYHVEYTDNVEITTIKTLTTLITTKTPAITTDVQQNSEAPPSSTSPKSLKNVTHLEIVKAGDKDDYKTISIVVIVGSICGLAILGFILRRLVQDDEEKDDGIETFDFPKYALLFDEEILHDAHM